MPQPRKARRRSASLRRMRWNEALLLLNGELRNPGAVRRLVRSGATLICADGGLRSALKLGLEPRLVIGDMDSLPPRLPRWLNTVYVCDFDQNLSDFEKCLQFAAARGIRKTWVAGATGGRLDHTMVNLALLETYSARMDIAMADQDARILGPGRHSFHCRRGQRVTLLPATPKASADTTGLRYKLAGETLERGSRGLSNEALSSAVGIRVRSGRLWILSD